MIAIRQEIKQIETGAANKDNNVLKVCCVGSRACLAL
jgi:hypothetical protein